jgi:hypothetical protein
MTPARRLHDLTPDLFEAELICAMEEVGQAHIVRGLTNGVWTKRQWLCLTRRLLQYRPDSSNWLWFSQQGNVPELADGHPWAKAGGEWLYDYAVMEYRTPPVGSASTVGQPVELTVAIESEWSTGTGHQEWDFDKLICSRARYKVFICDPGSTPRSLEATCHRLRDHLTSLRTPIDGDLWLLMWAKSSQFELYRLAEPTAPQWVKVRQLE